MLEWEEESVREVPEPAERTGFGSVLIDSAARQMSGAVERQYCPLGIVVRRNFPADEPTGRTGGNFLSGQPTPLSRVCALLSEQPCRG